jgi:hypothetical protein
MKQINWDEVEAKNRKRYERSYAALFREGDLAHAIKVVAEDAAYWNRMYRELAADVFNGTALASQYLVHTDSCSICRTGTKCKIGLEYYKKAFGKS